MEEEGTGRTGPSHGTSPQGQEREKPGRRDDTQRKERTHSFFRPHPASASASEHGQEPHSMGRSDFHR